MFNVSMPYPKPIAASQVIPVEFPKWVTPAGAPPVLVNSAEDEAAFIPPPSPRGDLTSQAESLGIKVDRRWGESRLRLEIDMAQSGQTGA